jgi:hypothetical protein
MLAKNLSYTFNSTFFTSSIKDKLVGMTDLIEEVTLLAFAMRQV